MAGRGVTYQPHEQKHANTGGRLSKLGQEIPCVSTPIDVPAPEYLASRHQPEGLKAQAPLIYVDNTNRPSVTRIPFRAIENMIQASAHAWWIGRPLLHHLTIEWTSGDWSWHQPVQDTLGKWLSRKSGGAYYIWVKEGNDGPHSHFLVHLKPGLTGADCWRVVIRALKRLSGLSALPKGTVQCRLPYYSGSKFNHTKRRTAYLCKGGGEEVRAFLKVKKTDHASIPGKQAGVSETLGVTARRRAGGCLPSGCRSVPKNLWFGSALSALFEKASTNDT